MLNPITFLYKIKKDDVEVNKNEKSKNIILL